VSVSDGVYEARGEEGGCVYSEGNREKVDGLQAGWLAMLVGDT
jgi:hypothetical protein